MGFSAQFFDTNTKSRTSGISEKYQHENLKNVIKQVSVLADSTFARWSNFNMMPTVSNSSVQFILSVSLLEEIAIWFRLSTNRRYEQRSFIGIL